MKSFRAAVLILGGLLLAGCGSAAPASTAPPAGAAAPAGGAAGDPATAGFNATDVMFLQMMIPHHGQGLAMVQLVRGKDIRADVAMLAAAIETTQAAEVQAMSGWLTAWGQPPTAEAHAHAAHGGMPGTSAAEIARLAAATGADFERVFLNMLIAHQDDAIQLARQEAAAGTNTAAKDLAGQIERSRSAQITQMLGYVQR